MASLIPLPAVSILFFVGMLALLEMGKRLGLRQQAIDPDSTRSGSGAIEAALFALFGLLIAFTFSGAASRFDIRRHEVVEEANNISTAYLRLDLLPAPSQPKLHDLFRKYLDTRIRTYQLLPDVDAAKEELALSIKLQDEIWKASVAACQIKKDPATTSLLITALNQMFDITTTRTMAAHMHPPIIIFVLLIGLGLGCSLLAGYGMVGSKKRNWILMISFAAIMAVTVFVILDIEYPRQGFFRIEAIDKVLLELRESM